MKLKLFATSLIILPCLFCATPVQATWITALNSGSWGDPTIWDSGTVPGTNDFTEVDSPYDVTIDTNAIVQYIFGSGTVTMAAGSVLYIMDPAGANGTYQLGTLDTSAPSNTVVYANNPFWAKHQNYCNLVFSNLVTTNLIDFYNGTVNDQDPATAMTVAGDMTVVGKIKVQQGADFQILGNLTMGTNSQWDCSSFNLTVVSNTVMGGLMLDLDAASGADNFMGNMLVSPTALGWNVSNVTNWMVGGSLTNLALIVGSGYGSITFNGVGTISGKPFTIPTMVVNGSYAIGTTITLTTNPPSLNGSLTFDLANTNQLVYKTKSTNSTLFYSGNLNIINSGPAPAPGKVYKFFNATNYSGTFAVTSFPALPNGLVWIDNLLLGGYLAVSGSAASPILTLTRNSGLLTLTWDSATFPGYRVLAQTNGGGIGINWTAAGSSTTSPFTININPTNPPVFFRLSNP